MQRIQEFVGRILATAGERKRGGGAGQGFMQQIQGGGAQGAQGIAGNLGGDTRVTVAVAANPVTEGQLRQWRITFKSGILPGIDKATIEVGQGNGKYAHKVVQHVVELVLHRWLAHA